MASKQKTRTGVTQSGPDAFIAIQGRPGAQVALLQSLVSLTVRQAHHKVCMVSRKETFSTGVVPFDPTGDSKTKTFPSVTT
jgi:hypothetical protein